MFFLFIAALTYAQNIFFQPELQGDRPHRVSWTFPNGQSEIKQQQITPTISCDLEKKWNSMWPNPRQLVMESSTPLVPGEKCLAKIENQNFSFEAPRRKILKHGPYHFAENFFEDDAFYLEFDGDLDPKRLQNKISLNIDGLEEAIEVEPLSPIIVEELNKRYGDHQFRFWFKPRRTLPTGKSFVLNIDQDQTFNYNFKGKVRAPFSGTLSCTRSKPTSPCSPLFGLRVNFSELVSPSEAQKITLQWGHHKLKPKISEDDSSSFEFPIKLEPETEVSLHIPHDLKDIDGRTLSNHDKFPLKFKIDHYPPLIKFPSTFGIIEALNDPHLTFGVRNIEAPLRLKMATLKKKKLSPREILNWLDRMNNQQDNWGEKDHRQKSIFENEKISTEELQMPHLKKIDHIEIVGFPLKGRGIHLLEAESSLLGKHYFTGDKPYFVSTMALVTDLALHLKLGKNNALVWVTNLSKGVPQKDIKVKLYNCQGKVIGEQVTPSDGVVYFALKKADHECDSKHYSLPKFIATGETIDDFAFTFSNWNQGIENWRFNLPYHSDTKSTNYQTIFDRPIYRLSDKVSFNILARDFTKKGLKLAKGKLPSSVYIKHYSGKEWKEYIRWNDLKAGSGAFQLGVDFPLGYYTLVFKTKEPNNTWVREDIVGTFEVKTFTVPTMNLVAQWKGNQKIHSIHDTPEVVGQLNYLHGSPASQYPLIIRAHLEKSFYQPPKGLEEFVWSNGVFETNEHTTSLPISTLETMTDEKGFFRWRNEKLPFINSPHRLYLDVEYLDASGQFQSKDLNLTVVPSSYLLGIKYTQHSQDRKRYDFETRLIDFENKPISDHRIEMTLYHQQTFSTRKKMVGSFYRYENFTKVKKIQKVCENKTNKSGSLNCSFKPKESGYYIIEVKARGPKREDVVAHTSFYHYDGEMIEPNLWFGGEAIDRADLILDKKSYQPNEKIKARFQTPFELSYVLVTKERDDIYSHQLHQLQRSSPEFELLLNEKDRPNIFVSALATRGRIAPKSSDGSLDLAKPAFRIGLAEIQLKPKDVSFDLKVDIKKKELRPRQEQRIGLQIIPKTKAPKKVKVALAVFDAALLELKPQHTFDIKNAFIDFWRHEISTSSSQLQVVGKRHFGLKARPQGGDGGKSYTREIFDTLLYWNPSISVTNQEIQVAFKTNDVISRFKVMAIAYSEDEFLFKEADFITKIDYIITSSLLPKLRMGDEIYPQFSILNTTKKETELIVEYENSLKQLAQQKIKLLSGGNNKVTFSKLKILNQREVEHVLTLKKSDLVVDKIKIKQDISPIDLVEIETSDLIALDKNKELSFTSQTQKVQLALQSSPLGALSGIEQYTFNYPYNCLEQKWARMLILQNPEESKKFLRSLATFQDQDGFFKLYFSQHEPDYFLTLYLLESSFWFDRLLSKDLTNKTLEGIKSLLSGTYQVRNQNSKKWEELYFRSLAVYSLYRPKEVGKLKLILTPKVEAKDKWSTALNKLIYFTVVNQHEHTSKLLSQLNQKLILKENEYIWTFSPSDFFYSHFESEVQLKTKFILFTQKFLPQSDFSKLFDREKVKFLRGLGQHKKDGHFGETISNTWGILLMKQFPEEKPEGITILGDRQFRWPSIPQGFLSLSPVPQKLNLSHQGKGTPFIDILSYKKADPNKKIEAGFSILNYQRPKRLKVGEKYNLDFDIKNDAQATQTGLRIPLPMGVTILNFETDGAYALFDEKDRGELRIYFDEFNRGRTSFSISFRPDLPGIYQVPGLEIEEMYAPTHRARHHHDVWTIEE